MNKELLKGLTPDQVEKVKALGGNMSDLLQLAKDEGVELTPEQLDAVNGGNCYIAKAPDSCPKCGSDDISVRQQYDGLHFYFCKCMACNHEWEAD